MPATKTSAKTSTKTVAPARKAAKPAAKAPIAAKTLKPSVKTASQPTLAKGLPKPPQAKSVVAKAVALAAPKLAKASKASKPVKAKPVKVAKAPKAVKAVKPVEEKVRKPKLVRDGFTMPKDEYAALETLKARAVRLGRPAKKSEVLRAGLIALVALGDAEFKTLMGRVPAIKTGRPSKA